MSTDLSLRLGVWLVARQWFVPGSWLLRRRLAEEPEDPDLQLLVANCAAALGRGDEVRRVLGARDDADALFVHVVLAVRACRRDEALAAVEAIASQTQPDDPLLLEAEALARGIPILDRVSAPGTLLLLRLGHALLQIGAIRGARLVFGRLCRLNPADPWLELMLANCHIQLGQHAAAGALLGSRRDPDALVCRIELAAIANQDDAVAALVADLWEQTEEGDPRRRGATEVLDDRGVVVEWPDRFLGAMRDRLLDLARSGRLDDVRELVDGGADLDGRPLRCLGRSDVGGPGPGDPTSERSAWAGRTLTARLGVLER